MPKKVSRKDETSLSVEVERLSQAAVVTAIGTAHGGSQQKYRRAGKTSRENGRQFMFAGKSGECNDGVKGIDGGKRKTREA